MIVRFLTLLLAATLCTVAVADEASVKKAVEARFNDVKVNSVTRTQYPGLYEVLIGDDVIVYTDEKVTYLFSTSEGGLALIDVKSGRNLTEEKRQKLSAIRFEDLPLDAAIKTVRGTGKRVFATFEDPNCPYCKRLWQDVAKLDNVTIYTFLYPILSPDSEARAKAIWCSKDRSRAWVDHMLTASMPAGPRLRNPIEKISRSADGFAWRTPTMFFTSGQRLVGARPDEPLTAGKKHGRSTAHAKPSAEREILSDRIVAVGSRRRHGCGQHVIHPGAAPVLAAPDRLGPRLRVGREDRIEERVDRNVVQLGHVLPRRLQYGQLGS